MLTTAEMQATRDKLRQAHALVDEIKTLFLSGGCTEGARMMNEVVHILDDEIAALDKRLAVVVRLVRHAG